MTILELLTNFLLVHGKVLMAATPEAKEALTDLGTEVANSGLLSDEDWAKLREVLGVVEPEPELPLSEPKPAEPHPLNSQMTGAMQAVGWTGQEEATDSEEE